MCCHQPPFHLPSKKSFLFRGFPAATIPLSTSLRCPKGTLTTRGRHQRILTMLFLSFRKRTQLVRAARKRGARRAEHIGAPRALLRVEALEDRCLLSVFPVTTVADNVPGSLRQAILDSNANPGADTITFNIGGGGVQTIHPTSALPDITDPVTIDGTTQPGFAGSPLIELNGGSAGSAAGLRITAGSSTVRGLVINGFALDGIVLSGSGGNLIAGNYIGT